MNTLLDRIEAGTGFPHICYEPQLQWSVAELLEILVWQHHNGGLLARAPEPPKLEE